MPIKNMSERNPPVVFLVSFPVFFFSRKGLTGLPFLILKVSESRFEQ